jgi:hypothetical protein
MVSLRYCPKKGESRNQYLCTIYLFFFSSAVPRLPLTSTAPPLSPGRQNSRYSMCQVRNVLPCRYGGNNDIAPCSWIIPHMFSPSPPPHTRLSQVGRVGGGGVLRCFRHTCTHCGRSRISEEELRAISDIISDHIQF